MQLIDDRGVALDAEYTAKADGGHLAIVLESMSWPVTGPPHATLTTAAPLSFS